MKRVVVGFAPFLGLTLLASCATFLVSPCIAGQIVNAGDGRYFSYGWGPLNDPATHTQWSEDAYVNDLSLSTEHDTGAGVYRGFVHPPDRDGGFDGSVEWHFQTDAGKPFGDDVTVTFRIDNFDQSYGFWFEWSADGSTYYPFFSAHGVNTHETDTVALKDHGFTGGEDLYLLFNASNRSGFSGAADQVQLFRQGSTTQFSSEQTFVVNTASAPEPVPEPSTLVTLGGLLGMGLIGYGWRRRKR